MLRMSPLRLVGTMTSIPRDITVSECFTRSLITPRLDYVTCLEPGPPLMRSRPQQSAKFLLHLRKFPNPFMHRMSRRVSIKYNNSLMETLMKSFKYCKEKFALQRVENAATTVWLLTAFIHLHWALQCVSAECKADTTGCNIGAYWSNHGVC